MLTIYILLIILIIVGIVLGIKLIILTNKATKTMDNLNEKLNTLNGIVSMYNKIDDFKSAISHFIIGKFKRKERG